jgi:hypothetical protein
MSNEEIGDELNKLENESLQLKEAIINLCWWMRGGISHIEAWNLSEKERSMINKLIKTNIETMKKTKMPMF